MKAVRPAPSTPPPRVDCTYAASTPRKPDRKTTKGKDNGQKADRGIKRQKTGTTQDKDVDLPPEWWVIQRLANLQMPLHHRTSTSHGENNCLIESVLQTLMDKELIHEMTTGCRKTLCAQIRTHLELARLAPPSVPGQGKPYLAHDTCCPAVLQFLRNSDVCGLHLAEHVWGGSVQCLFPKCRPLF
jgi:hypothetical protein